MMMMKQSGNVISNSLLLHVVAYAGSSTNQICMIPRHFLIVKIQQISHSVLKYLN